MKNDQIQNKVFILRFRRINKDIFDAINNNRKKFETRAATKRYKTMKPWDRVVLICERHKFNKLVKRVQLFPTIGALLKHYKPSQINPKLKTEKELRAMYNSFPAYKEKIKKCGLLVFELK